MTEDGHKRHSMDGFVAPGDRDKPKWQAEPITVTGSEPCLSCPARRGTLCFAPARDQEPYLVPSKSYVGDAGYDIPVSKTTTVPSHGFADVPSNVLVAMPEGTWGLVIGRSSTFYRLRLMVNIGVIDEGYRGELTALAYNPTDSDIVVTSGSRIAQLIVVPKSGHPATSVHALNEGHRGSKGFGSTGP